MASNPAKARKPRTARSASAAPVAAVPVAVPAAPDQTPPPAPVPTTAPAPAPAPAIVVKGPKAGFRRAGLLFGSEPRKLGVAELGEEIEARGRLLAIVREPRLITRIHLHDGTVRPFSDEEIAALGLMVGGVPESQLDQAHVAMIAQLTGDA